MLTMSIANHFYTLWDVYEIERWDSSRNVTYIITHYNYRRNLSMVKEEAIKKITELAGDASWDEDLSLKGQSKYFTKRRIAAMEPWKFTFGMLTGTDIRISDDVWQLNRAMTTESNVRRRVYARRRLIELGEMVKYGWYERTKEFRTGTDEELQKAADSMCMDLHQFKHDYGTEVTADKITFRSWCPKRLHAYKLLDKNKGHHFQNGKRIDVKLQLFGRIKEIETQYGTSYLMTLIDTESRVYKYMGSVRLDIATDKFTPVKATVKHEEYKGQKETKLQRIKIIEVKPKELTDQELNQYLDNIDADNDHR